MSVYKSGNGYRAEVWFDGRRVKTKSGFKTKRDARKWLENNRAFFTTNAGMSFDSLVHVFKERHMPTVRFQTQKFYSDMLVRIEEHFKYLTLTAITPGMVEDFRNKLKDEDLSVKYINDHLSLVRMIFDKAVKWELMTRSPYRLTPLKKAHQEYQWWDKREYIDRFLICARATKYYLVYRIALETGMRLGEIIALEVSDIDFERGSIRVNKTWHDKRRVLGPPKHNKARVITLGADHGLIHNLAKFAANRDSVLFTSIHNARPRGTDISSIYFQAICKRADVPRIRFHDLRHTFASWYMKDGGDFWRLMAILGHSNSQTTLRYAHHAPDAGVVPKMSYSPQSPHSGEDLRAASIELIR